MPLYYLRRDPFELFKLQLYQRILDLKERRFNAWHTADFYRSGGFQDLTSPETGYDVYYDPEFHNKLLEFISAPCNQVELLKKYAAYSRSQADKSEKKLIIKETAKYIEGEISSVNYDRKRYLV